MLTNKLIELSVLATQTVTEMPDSKPKAPSEIMGPLQDVIGLVKYFALLVLVIALIGAGVEFVRNRNHGTSYDGGQIVKILFGVIIVSSATTIITFLID